MSKHQREGTIFYKSFYDAIKILPDKERLEVYDAIFYYDFNGKISELFGISLTIFTLIKPQLDANKKRYKNGSKGGRPSKHNSDNVFQDNQTITKTKPNDNQTITKTKPNKNINKNININNNINNNNKNLKELTVLKNKKSVSQQDKIEISQRYDVPIEFVESKLEDLFNYIESTGKSYKDYVATLRNWVKRDRDKIKFDIIKNKPITVKI